MPIPKVCETIVDSSKKSLDFIEEWEFIFAAFYFVGLKRLTLGLDQLIYLTQLTKTVINKFHISIPSYATLK